MCPSPVFIYISIEHLSLCKYFIRIKHAFKHSKIQHALAYLSRIIFYVPLKDEIYRLLQYVFVLAVTVTEKPYQNELPWTGLRLSVVGQKYFKYFIFKLFGNKNAYGHKFDESSSHY
jgi:hypothetical protein